MNFTIPGLVNNKFPVWSDKQIRHVGILVSDVGVIRRNGIECEFAAELLLDVWTRVVFTWTQGDRLSKDGGSS